MYTTPKAQAGTEFGFETTMVMKYLAEQDKLDAEIVRVIKQALYQQIIGKHKAIEEAVFNKNLFVSVSNEYGELEDKSAVLNLTKEDFEALDSKIYDGLNQNKHIKDIIQDWLMNPEDGVITVKHKDDQDFQLLLQEDSKAPEDIFSLVMGEIQNSTVEAYEKQITKTAVKNPLFELFRTMGFEVSGAGETNLM